MWKKRKIDFILYEDNDEILVFRFYPRQSNCHSFNDVPPTCWGEVYKVYYAYSVFRRFKDDNYTEVLFECLCDECSVIDEVAYRIQFIVEGHKSITRIFDGKEYVIELLDKEILPEGDGVSWTIKECRGSGLYGIVLWKYNEIGYRFYLAKDKLKEFGLYLQQCCDYMLAHGEPI